MEMIFIFVLGVGVGLSLAYIQACENDEKDKG